MGLKEVEPLTGILIRSGTITIVLLVGLSQPTKRGKKSYNDFLDITIDNIYS
jgi:hypothetical protein